MLSRRRLALAVAVVVLPVLAACGTLPTAGDDPQDPPPPPPTDSTTQVYCVEQLPWSRC